MDNYQQAYQKYSNTNMYQSQQQAIDALGYAGIGGMPIIGTMGGASIPNTIPAAFGSLQATSFGPNDPIASAMPMHQQQQHLKPQVASSSRIITEPDCQIFCCNKDADPVEFGAQQMISIDGKLFVEHVPGHSIVFVPNKFKPSQIMGNISGQRVKGSKSRIDKPARPCNVFFKYRSHKLAELQEKFPKLNQTVISRMVAEHWKNETDDVKNKFKLEYKEDMNKYEMAKRVRRSKSDAASQSTPTEMEDSSSLSGNTAIDLPFYGSLGLVESPGDDHGLGLGIGSAGQPRHRSFTLPVDDKQQIGISRLIH
ncbi:hypothetical protein IW140_006174 [Coemansia sp. RSA 1813]|nr:hypothetical protein EV178_003919 [Coemansia sp. RSA 1646]KAJ2210601.1 hypothetical protein EV179_006125 [Coemansia sp. RSA 487]KAJ2563282.1 hypothetical protein IW140_006174 [Coemansia sp. RSA 1813]